MSVESITWSVARTGGLLAYALLTVSVAMGLALSLGWKSKVWTRFVTNEVHRFVTLLSLIFMAVHGLAILLDPFIQMGLSEVLVPFASSYRPMWVGLGVTAGWLALAVHLSERIRGRIGYAWWRRFHVLAFAAFGLALVHGIATGSDTRTPWALGLYFGSVALVGALLVLRLFPDPPKRTRPLVGVLTAALAVGVVVFTIQQPLQPGWSARAGGEIPSAAAVATTELGALEAQPAVFDGQIARFGAALQVEGRTQDGRAAFLVQLTGGDDAISGEVVINTSTQEVCQGTVTGVGDTTIQAQCSTADGVRWSLRLAVTQAAQDGIHGTLEVARLSTLGGSAGSTS